jgi:hypothetical protein
MLMLETKWSSEMEDQMRALWTAGKTGTQIANALSKAFDRKVSRSSIMGKARRMGLPLRKIGSAPRTPKPPKPARKPNFNIRGDKPEDVKPPSRSDLPDVPGPRACGIFELSGCRWPVGTNLFCNERVEGDSSYCAAHWARSHA